MGFTEIVVLVVIGLIAFFAIMLVIAKLYRRASKEVSFVRTGAGGQKVVMNGGALVFPVFHEVIPVNMNTLRLEVRRSNEQALITRDRMRVDVLAEFYVRVKPTAESIANAAQTLGTRTMQPQLLKELVEGKFVDALRAVAAEMAMTELHEQRVDFVQKVQQVVSEDLLKNGLELESVSLTGLDQTSKEYFNPDNAFDAEGLTRLTEEIEARRKRRNDIEQETIVEIERKNLDAERQRLEIGREQEYARLEQEREIEVRRADQNANIAREQAEKKREAEEAEIQAEQQVQQTKILADRAVEEEQIAKERVVKEKDIEKSRAIESAEIEKQKAIETADVAKARAIETAEVEKRKVVELSEQDRAIAIAEKSREQSESEARAAEARAEAVREEERVITAQETEIAERTKQIELIEAAKIAETDAISITVAATAEKEAAEDKAEAIRIAAEADASRERITAQGAADAEILAAEASKQTYAVEAEGKRSINEASNTLSAEQIAMQVKLAVVDQLPEIIRESVKPMEQIDDIKILQVDGLNPGGSAGGSASSAEAGAGNGNLADQVVNSALRYRAQAPIVESLLKEVGMDGSDINGLLKGINPDADASKE